MHHQQRRACIILDIYSSPKWYRRRSTTGSIHLCLCSLNNLHRQLVSGISQATLVVACAHRSAVIERETTSSAMASSYYLEVVRLGLQVSPFSYTPWPIDVGCGMPALAVEWSLLSRFKLWTAFIVHGLSTSISRHRTWTGRIALGLQKLISLHQELPGPSPLACTIVTLRQCGLPASSLACTQWSTNIICGLYASPLSYTHGQLTFDVAFPHHLWPAHNDQPTLDITYNYHLYQFHYVYSLYDIKTYFFVQICTLR